MKSKRERANSFLSVYFDTNIWVYAFERNPVFGESALELLQAMEKGMHQHVSSLFVLGELLVAPARKNIEFAAAAYRRLFSSSQVRVLPYTQAAVDVYVQLRAHRVKALDALHLATAAAHGVDRFVTNDDKLLTLQVPGIGRICTPQELRSEL